MKYPCSGSKEDGYGGLDVTGGGDGKPGSVGKPSAAIGWIPESQALRSAAVERTSSQRRWFVDTKHSNRSYFIRMACIPGSRTGAHLCVAQPRLFPSQTIVSIGHDYLAQHVSKAGAEYEDNTSET